MGATVRQNNVFSVIGVIIGFAALRSKYDSILRYQGCLSR